MFLVASEFWKAKIVKNALKNLKSRFSESKLSRTASITYCIKDSIDNSLPDKGIQ